MRFIERHETAIAGLFGEVLLLCARSGLAKVGVIAVDGTRVQANASRDANVDYEQLARAILEEAKAIGAAEDELYGDRRGDELPEELSGAQVGAGGYAKPSGAWRPGATARRGRCPAHGPSASGRPSGAWKRSCGRSAGPTRPMSATARDA